MNSTKYIDILISYVLPFLIVSFPILAFFFVAISRASYPFQLEWIESSLYLDVLRVMQGKQLYCPPNADFVPALYTPFFFYFSAAFAIFTKNIMFSMRIVSILSTINTIANYG